MSPTLYMMRHGQGQHSEKVTKDGYRLHDPPLTEEGFAQCHARRDAFPHHDDVQLLLASPLRRTIQTCSTTFSPVTARKVPVVAMPLAIEITCDPCDTGSPASVLAPEFEVSRSGFELDLTHVVGASSDWLEHAGDFSPDHAIVKARATKLRRWIRDLPHQAVVLVTHGQFAHYMTGNMSEEGVQTTRWWDETELRSYTFADDADASIVETEESSHSRRPLDLN